ncbi:MAG: IMP dehydrogenase [bacterium]|nr:IMP dehydrogenase [bacterium]
MNKDTKNLTELVNFPQYLTFDDVLLLPGYSNFSLNDISIETSLTKKLVIKLPIIAAPMDNVCDSKLAISLGKLGGFGIIHRNQSIEQQSEHVQLVVNEGIDVGASIGVGFDSEDRLKALIHAGIKVICFDSGRGHSEEVIRSIKTIKERYIIQVIAGNIATYEGAIALLQAGADALRVGKGAGSICKTRIMSGVGVPQFTAIQETVRAAKEFGKYVIADGGIRTSGDIVKALAAGASSVMLGSLLAGTDEAPGDVIEIDKKLYKSYRGMGSVNAMKSGSADRYGQEESLNNAINLVPEGVEGLVSYKGNLKDHLHQLIGGLTSGMLSIGARNIEELHQKSKFIRITSAGIIESHPHNIYKYE